MDGLVAQEISELFSKALKENERQDILNLIFDMPEEAASIIIDTGKQFNKSSAVNGTWFWRTLPIMAEYLDGELTTWLEEGNRICRGNWECVLSYLKAGPDLVGQVNRNIFMMWIQIGRSLVRFSNHDANWYFKYSGDLLASLEREEQELLLSWVVKIMDNSWPAAVACLKAWPEIRRQVGTTGLEAVLELGYGLSIEFPDDTKEFFHAVPAFVERSGPELLAKWAEGAGLIKDGKRGAVASYFIATPSLIEKIKTEEFVGKIFQWAQWGNRLAVEDNRTAQVFFELTPQVLRALKWEQMEKWLELIVQVGSDYSFQGAYEFVRITPELLGQLEIMEISEWVDSGLKKIKGDKRIAYFTLKSQESRDNISKLRSGLHLETVKKVLLLYCEGLTGEAVIIRNSSELPGRIHGDNKFFGTLDTRRIYLPDVVKISESETENLRFYRAMMVHLTAHKEFGTLNLDKEELRELESNKVLGLIFEMLEDARVDYLAMRKYPGLGRDYLAVLRNTGVVESCRNQLAIYFLTMLWSEEKLPSASISPVVEKEIQSFWYQLTSQEGSARESLVLARRLLSIIEQHDVELHNQLVTENEELNGANSSYRGSLCYDLLFISRDLDEDIIRDSDEKPLNGNGFKAIDDSEEKLEKNSQMTRSFTGEGGFNPNSDFYIFLKKLLAKFHEDEENPYRLIAYYDEWDRSLNDYKKDWCKVREILLKPSTGRFVTETLEEYHGMINTLKRYFGMLRPDRFRRYGRQEDGEHIDIDAVVEAMVEIRAGASPTGGFYVRRDKRERDVAVAFLLDLSYSTEEKIPGTGKTLLDVEKESVIVMAEALEVLGDKYAIYGFNSDGRDKINFYVVKDFGETYSFEVKQRYGGLQSHGMTRLASAIRHAVFKLEKVQASIKILMLLSDGRPFDFDYNSGLTKDYEEFYAETDTRMALREAKMRGVNPFCITVDRKAHEYLEHIFGNVSYIIIDDVSALPTKLTETYKNLTT